MNQHSDPSLLSTDYLSTVWGQETAVTTLRRAIHMGRVHHAYLFDGPEGVGKEKAAFGLAQILVCEERKSGEAFACGRCRACLRALPARDEKVPRHPDVVVIERGLYEPAQIGRNTPETADISVDQIRTLIVTKNGFGPHEGRARVFILKRAHELSISATNSLLKSLEEPQTHTHFILLSSRAEMILPTLRSRTFKLRFGFLAHDIIRTLLMKDGYPESEAQVSADLARGSFAKLDKVNESLHQNETQEFLKRFLDLPLAAPFAPEGTLCEFLFSCIEFSELSKKDKENLKRRLIILSTELTVQAKNELQKGSAEAQTCNNALRLATYVSYINKAIVQLEHNGSTQLTLESMLLQMKNYGSSKMSRNNTR